ncbi:MAG: hypothetical protein DRJ34_01560 [Thermoprotei archaeon]|nr:MAG: hypothetical protein DRJ34_01560 [Thermoprotei archaeon]
MAKEMEFLMACTEIIMRYFVVVMSMAVFFQLGATLSIVEKTLLFCLGVIWINIPTYKYVVNKIKELRQ